MFWVVFDSTPEQPPEEGVEVPNAPHIEWWAGEWLVASFPSEAFVMPHQYYTIPQEEDWRFVLVADDQEFVLATVETPALEGVEALQFHFTGLDECVDRVDQRGSSSSCSVQVDVQPMSFEDWEFYSIMGPE